MQAIPSFRLIAAILLQAACALAAAAGEPAVTVPFIYEDARVYVPVRINGGAPRWFILDTGAAGTIIDTAAAAAAGLPVQGERRVQGAGAGSSLQGTSGAAVLHVGDVALRVAQPAVMDLVQLLGPTSGRAPAGIVGAQFFREHFVGLDFERRELTVRDAEEDPPAGFGASVPLTFESAMPHVQVRLALPDGRRVEANALVDLGAKSTLLLPEPFIERARLRAAFPAAVIAPFGAGVGGATSYAFARAPRLELAAAPDIGMDRPVVGLSVAGSLRSTWHDGLLGAEFLARFRVGFDYAHGRLWLAPRNNAPARFDRSGLFLVGQGPDFRRIVVRQVRPDGPGAMAGLRPGDELVSLDGQPVAAMRLGEVREYLKTPARAAVRVGYRRGAEETQAELLLRDLL
ncbi:MAG: aspartyl protease family protein [Telluria sp.]